MPDWDARRYHRLSDPQLAWGRTVLARLAPAPGERILDLGCGTGRLTTEIAAWLEKDHRPRTDSGPRTAGNGSVVGLDRSEAMLAEAVRASGIDATRRRPAYVQGDGSALPFENVFDAVFSAATFHWILNHERLFASVHTALKPGGRLVAQCGGAGNLDRLLEKTHRLMRDARYAQSFGAWSDPWLFAGIDDTRARLDSAGFEVIDVSIEAAPTTLPGDRAFADFIACVCVRHHIDRLPPGEREAFVDELTQAAAADNPRFTLDYCRVNIVARKWGL
jgi:trans-aconitate 2-methyltransferase